jgi:hypothetical protein
MVTVWIYDEESTQAYMDTYENPTDSESILDWFRSIDLILPFDKWYHEVEEDELTENELRMCKEVNLL